MKGNTKAEYPAEEEGQQSGGFFPWRKKSKDEPAGPTENGPDEAHPVDGAVPDIPKEGFGKNPNAKALRRDLDRLSLSVKALQDQKKQIEKYIDITRVMFVTIGADGTVTMINKKACEILGYDRTEVIGRNWFETFIPSRIRKTVKANFQKVMAGELEPPETFENVVVTRDGQERIVRWHNALLRDENGIIMGATSSGEDITERKRIEFELTKSEERYRDLVENISEIILTTDNKGRVIYSNRSLMRKLGYTEEEASKLRFLDLMPVEELGTWNGLLARIRKGEVLEKLETTLVAKDGSQLYVEGNISPIIRDNRFSGVRAIFHDIMVRKEAELRLLKVAEDLERSNSDLEQFAYVASHDLQEPLRMVSSYLQLLKRRSHHNLDESSQEFINFAIDGANRMKTLINDLLKYSRVGTRQKPMVEADVSLVLANSLLNLQIAVSDAKADVTFDDMPTIKIDENQIMQLFQNLVSNALKFKTRETPKIHIGSRKEDDHWLFWVSDNGIGIDQKDADQIFVLFQRLNRKDQYPGTGIGLAVCKKIVERHQGRIWVESELGKGATFYFTIPEHYDEEIPTETEEEVESTAPEGPDLMQQMGMINGGKDQDGPDTEPTKDPAADAAEDGKVDGSEKGEGEAASSQTESGHKEKKGLGLRIPGKGFGSRKR